MPSEERRFSSISYGGLEVVPSNGHDGLQITLSDSPEVTIEPGLQAIHEKTSTESIEKEEALPSPSRWKIETLGFSNRHWIIAIVALVLIAVIIGAAVGATRKHSTSPTVKTLPFYTQLQCPSINNHLQNLTSTSPSQISSYQFKKSCNHTINPTSPFTLIPNLPATPDTGAFDFTNPIAALSFNSCIAECAGYTTSLGTISLATNDSRQFCFRAWFDADQTNGDDVENCFFYSLKAEGNYTADTLLVSSEDSFTGMAVMVAMDGESFIGTYLSGNGDWGSA